MCQSKFNHIIELAENKVTENYKLNRIRYF